MWMGAIKPKPNIAKTELVVFGSKTIQDNMKPLLPSQIVQDYQTASVVCDVGVLFDSDLSLGCVSVQILFHWSQGS